jgi:nucleotide-binding universal stress UspA family protein
VAGSSILVPLDGSYLSEAILPHMARLAHGRELRLVLLHVVAEDPATRAGRGDAAARTRRQALAAEHERYLREREEQIADPLVTVEVPVRFGNPVDEILACAREVGAQLIAMTTHGRTGLRRLVFGSVAAAVLQRSPVPVALYRPPGL